jgi:hypothetical protein
VPIVDKGAGAVVLCSCYFLQNKKPMLKHLPKQVLPLLGFAVIAGILVGTPGKAAAATHIITPVADACYAGGSSLVINWSSSDLFGQKSYVSYSDGSTTPSYQNPSNIPGGDTASGRKSLQWSLPQVTGNSYSVYVATLTGLNTPTSASQTGNFSIDANGPTLPIVTNVSATPTSVSLAWTNVSDAGCMPLSGYRVFRNDIQIGTSASPAYTDANLTPGATYKYVIQAYDGFGSSVSSIMTVTTPLLPVKHPTGGLSSDAASSLPPQTPATLLEDIQQASKAGNGLSGALNSSGQSSNGDSTVNGSKSNSIWRSANTGVLVGTSVLLAALVVLGATTVRWPTLSSVKVFRSQKHKKESQPVAKGHPAQHYHTRSAPVKQRPAKPKKHHRKR